MKQMRNRSCKNCEQTRAVRLLLPLPPVWVQAQVFSHPDTEMYTGAEGYGIASHAFAAFRTRILLPSMVLPLRLSMAASAWRCGGSA